MKTLFLLLIIVISLTGCVANNPPGQPPNYYIHQLGLEGGGG